MAARELVTTINLACLAHDITQAILDGTQPEGLTLDSCEAPPARLDRAAPAPRLPGHWHLDHRRASPMPTNPEIRYWHDRVRAAEAELDAATTHADLKLAAQRLMRARRRPSSSITRRP